MPYIGRDLNRGNYLKLDDISSSFNGSTQTFNLTVGGSAFTPGSAFSILVSLGGVIQEPESAYQVNNSEITFANAPTAQDSFFCIALGVALGIGVPGNGTVNGTQIAKPFNYDGFFYLNDATNRVGINSSIPSETLDIVGNTKISGILTALTYSGPIVNASGISTFYDLRVSNNLTVEGTTTTLDTNLIGVDRIEVGANSNTVVGVAITQSGTADILNLYDSSTPVFVVKDGGRVGIGSAIPTAKLDVDGQTDLDDLIVSGVTTSIGTFHIRPSSGALSPKIYYDDSLSDALIFSDNVELRFGGSSDFKIFHNSSNSFHYVVSRNNAPLLFRSGTGTTGQLDMAKFLPSGAIELMHNGTKRLETTNSGVGISSSLTVSGISTFTSDINANGNLFIPEYIKHSGDIDSRFGFSGTDTFAIDTAGSERLEINSSGTGRFKGGAFLLTNGRLNVNYNAAHSSTYYLDNDAQILVSNGDSAGTKKSVLKLGGEAALVYGGGSSNLIIADRQNERLRITSSGNVGIGTDDPKISGLHVDGVIFAGTPYIQSGLQYGGVRLQSNHSGTQSGGVIYGGTHNDNNHAIFFRRGYDGTQDTLDINEYGMFRIFTGGSLGSQAEKLRISGDKMRIASGISSISIGSGADGQRRVDIVTGADNGVLIRPTTGTEGAQGSSDAIQDLIQLRTPWGSSSHNTGNAGARFGIQMRAYNVDGGFDEKDPAKSAAIYAVSEDQASGYWKNVGLAFYTSAYNQSQAEKVRIDTNGKVGIGVTNPSSKLTIKDETGGQSLLIEGASGNDVVVLGSVNGATNRGELIIKEGTTGDAYVKLSSKASTSNFIMNNNLGIGTDNPLSLLSLGASANPTLEFKDYTNHARAIITGGANGQLVFTTDVGNGVPNSDFIFRADSSTNEIVRFNSSGLVGIGTNNPGQELSIWNSSPAIRLVDTNPYEAGAYGQVAQSGNVLQLMAHSGNTSGHGSIFFYSMNDNDSFNTYRIADNYHLWYNSGEEKMRLIGGKVGIGTNVPTQLIDVYKTTNDAVIKTRTAGAGAYFEADSAATSAGYHGLSLSVSGTEKWFVGSYNSHNFHIKDGTRNAGAERFTIVDGTGKVGITSTAPTGALDIRTGTHAFDGFIKLTKDADFNPSIEYYRTTGSGPTWYGAQLRLMTGDFTYSYAGSSTLGNHSYSEILRITSAGKVGISTSIANAKLEIGNVTGGYMNTSGIQVNRPHSLGLLNGIHVYTDAGYNPTASYRTAAFKATGTSGHAFACSTDAGSNGQGGTNTAKIDFNGNATFTGTITAGGSSGSNIEMAQDVRLVSLPNSTWSAGLKVGGNGNASNSTYGSMVVTNGNLHLDARDGSYGVYLNWYGGANGTYFGNGSGSQAGRIDSSGNLSLSGNYPSSDLRLKENIQNISGATDTIKSLVGKTFTWKAEAGLDSYKHYGFIAQEVQKVTPDLVKDIGCHYFDKDDKLVTNIDPTESDEDRKNKGITQSLTVNNEGVTPILVEAMKELIAKVEILEAKVAALEGS